MSTAGSLARRNFPPPFDSGIKTYDSATTTIKTIPSNFGANSYGYKGSGTRSQGKNKGKAVSQEIGWLKKRRGDPNPVNNTQGRNCRGKKNLMKKMETLKAEENIKKNDKTGIRLIQLYPDKKILGHLIRDPDDGSDFEEEDRNVAPRRIRAYWQSGSMENII
ncbi:uncharacterized protein VP01_1639g10 [Puccinia sorghi]|uniref:Uncharacterized protein n=1 Tax=Puccinia sorghi TaxID=27349 RepID=A0A0L6VGR8_9BASI|nr:uncharacterized protein VP01_1639g10 [Puccinia sorghi]